MATIEEIITDILQREGGLVNNPADKGGRTDKGISEKYHPEAWADGKVTEAEARTIYLKKYVLTPGFDKIKGSHLQTQLVDFGVHSGPQLAIMKLQKILGGIVVDGVIGPETLAALEVIDDMDHLNNKLMCERIRMIGRIVGKDRSQAQFLNGWLERACQFLR